jgi:hypothetical protein
MNEKYDQFMYVQEVKRSEPCNRCAVLFSGPCPLNKTQPSCPCSSHLYWASKGLKTELVCFFQQQVKYDEKKWINKLEEILETVLNANQSITSQAEGTEIKLQVFIHACVHVT